MGIEYLLNPTATLTTLGRISGLTSNDGISQSFTYDEAANGASRTKLTTAVANGVTRKLQYHAATGRLKQIDRIIDGHTFTQQIAYDNNGDIASRTYPDNKVQTIGYDPTTGLPSNSEFNSTKLADFTYNPMSWQLQTQKNPGMGMTINYAYRPDQIGLASMQHIISTASALNKTWNYT